MSFNNMPGGCCCVSTGWFDWYGPKNTQNTVGYGMDAFPSAYPTPRHYRVNSMLWREPSMRPEGEPYGMWSFPDYWHVRMYPSEPAIYHEAAIIQALHLPVPASEGKVWVIRQGDIDNEKWNGGWYVNMVEDPFLALSQPSWTKGTGCIIEDETKITVSGSNPTTGCYVTQTVSPFLLTAGPPDYQIMRGHSRVRVNAATGELSDIYIKIKGTGTGSGNLDSLVVVDLSDGSVVSDYGLPNMPVNEDGEDDSPYGNENFPADEVIVTETYDNTWDISFWLGNHNDSYGNITIGPYSGGFVIDANSGDGIYVYDVSVREFTGNAPSSFDLALFNATHKTIDLHYFLDLDDADNNKRETSVFNYGHWFPHYNRVGQWNNENFGYYQGAGLYNWFDDIDKGSMMLRNRNVENIGRGLQVSNDAIHILNPVLYDGFPAASSAWMYFKLPNTGGGPEIQFGGNGSTLYWVEHPTTCDSWGRQQPPQGACHSPTNSITGWWPSTSLNRTEYYRLAILPPHDGGRAFSISNPTRAFAGQNKRSEWGFTFGPSYPGGPDASLQGPLSNQYSSYRKTSLTETSNIIFGEIIHDEELTQSQWFPELDEERWDLSGCISPKSNDPQWGVNPDLGTVDILHGGALEGGQLVLLQASTTNNRLNRSSHPWAGDYPGFCNYGVRDWPQDGSSKEGDALMDDGWNGYASYDRPAMLSHVGAWANLIFADSYPIDSGIGPSGTGEWEVGSVGGIIAVWGEQDIDIIENPWIGGFGTEGQILTHFGPIEITTSFDIWLSVRVFDQYGHVTEVLKKKVWNDWNAGEKPYVFGETDFTLDSHVPWARGMTATPISSSTQGRGNDSSNLMIWFERENWHDTPVAPVEGERSRGEPYWSGVPINWTMHVTKPNGEDLWFLESYPYEYGISWGMDSGTLGERSIPECTFVCDEYFIVQSFPYGDDRVPTIDHSSSGEKKIATEWLFSHKPNSSGDGPYWAVPMGEIDGRPSWINKYIEGDSLRASREWVIGDIVGKVSTVDESLKISQFDRPVWSPELEYVDFISVSPNGATFKVKFTEEVTTPTTSDFVVSILNGDFISHNISGVIDIGESAFVVTPGKNIPQSCAYHVAIENIHGTGDITIGLSPTATGISSIMFPTPTGSHVSNLINTGVREYHDFVTVAETID